MSAVHVRVRAGGEDYAVPVDGVLEITELGEVTPVPGARGEVLGVRNLRGQVIAVVDLAKLLGLPDRSQRRRIVVAEDGERRAGLAVDSVVDVSTLPEPAEAAESECVSGAALVDGALVGILDLAAVFATLSADETVP